MKKLIATLALGLAVLGFSGAVMAQAASAPEATASAAAAPAPAAAPAAAAASEAASAPAAAASTPVANKGDVAWMIVATLLVIMMTVPGLALFYGGLVRSKNMLSVLMQVLVTFSLISVLWFVYGYSLAFTEGNSFVGGLDRLFLNGVFNPKTGAVRVLTRSGDDTMLSFDERGGVREVNIETGRIVLTDAMVRRLARAALQIERVFAGRAQDIEWLTVGSQLYIVQARPYVEK